MTEAGKYQDQDIEPQKRSRVVDTTNRDARLAIGHVAAQMAPWRSQIARLRAHAVRPMSTEARRRYLTECARIEHDIATTLAAFEQIRADLSPRVAAHSRVTDVARALAGAEEQLRQVTSMLRGS